MYFKLYLHHCYLTNQIMLRGTSINRYGLLHRSIQNSFAHHDFKKKLSMPHKIIRVNPIAQNRLSDSTFGFLMFDYVRLSAVFFLRCLPLSRLEDCNERYLLGECQNLFHISNKPTECVKALQLRPQRVCNS